MDSKAAGSNVTANCKDSFSDEPSTLLVSMPAAPSASAFCIRRSSHSHDLVRDFSLMLQDEEFVDVTLVCEDGSLNAHKMFLSSYSPYFKSIFAKLAASVNKSNYPVIVLKDLPFCDLRAIVDFIYRGEVTVPQTQWKSLVKSAESLKIRGLVGLRDPDSSDVTLNNKKRRKRRKKRSASASDGKTPKDGTYECSSDASASVSDGQSVSDDADSYEGTEGDEEYDSSTQITAVQGDERNSVSTVGDVEPSNLMEQSMIVSGDVRMFTLNCLLSPTNTYYFCHFLSIQASESASLCNRNSYTPNPPVGGKWSVNNSKLQEQILLTLDPLNQLPISPVTDHTGLVSQMDAMTDSMNHHANSPPIGGLLNFDQHSIHPVAGPSSGHSGLARSQGKTFLTNALLRT